MTGKPKFMSGVGLGVVAVLLIGVTSQALAAPGSTPTSRSDSARAKFPPGNFPKATALALGYTSGYVVTWDASGEQDAGLPVEVTRDYVVKSKDRRIVTVSAGDDFTLALTSAGRVIAWGLNDKGQATVPPEALTGIAQIEAGADFAFAVTTDGRLISWGSNDCGQLNIPVEATTDVAMVSAAECHSLILKKDGTVIAWGTPPPTDAGWGSQQEYPPMTVPLEVQGNVTSIHASPRGGYAVKAEGSMLAWSYHWRPGTDDEGEFARIYDYWLQTPDSSDAAMNSESGLIPVDAVSNVAEVSSGGMHRMSLKRDGSVFVWGNSNFKGYNNGVLQSVVKIRGSIMGHWNPCLFSLHESGNLLRNCPGNSSLFRKTPAVALTRTIDFDVRYRHVASVIGIADANPGSLPAANSWANGRNAQCDVFMYSDDPRLGPPAPLYPGRPQTFAWLGPDLWFEYRRIGNKTGPWEKVYPAGNLADAGPDSPIPNVTFRFICGKVKPKAAVPEFDIRLVNSFGPGPSVSTSKPPPPWEVPE